MELEAIKHRVNKILDITVNNIKKGPFKKTYDAIDQQMNISLEEYNKAYSSMCKAGAELRRAQVKAALVVEQNASIINRIAVYSHDYVADIHDIEKILCEYGTKLNAEDELIAHGANSYESLSWMPAVLGYSPDLTLASNNAALLSKEELNRVGAASLITAGMALASVYSLICAGPVIYFAESFKKIKDMKKALENIITNTATCKELTYKINTQTAKIENFLKSSRKSSRLIWTLKFGKYSWFGKFRKHLLFRLVNCTKTLIALANQTITIDHKPIKKHEENITKERLFFIKKPGKATIRSLIGTTKDQATAGLTDLLNTIRESKALKEVSSRKEDLIEAVKEINEGLKSIKQLISSDRGSAKGVHGYIAERAEVAIRNARENIEGKADIAEWVNNNGPEDIVLNGTPVQMKFVQAGNRMSLNACLDHLDKYNWFIEGADGKYMIPKDYYEQVCKLWNMGKEEAGKLSRKEFGQWKYVHDTIDKKGLSLDDIQPSVLDYKDVQVGTIHKTMSKEKASLKKRGEERIDEAEKMANPSLKDGSKAVVVGAVLEFSTAFIEAILEKKKADGKLMRDFTSEDWKEVATKSGLGAAKGAIRGGATYFATNFTPIPSAVASSIITASFGTITEVNLLRKDNVTEEEFVSHMEDICLDSSVSAISSLIGQAIIPVPVLGALIGNTVGTLMKTTTKQAVNAIDSKMLRDYNKDIKALNEECYSNYLETISLFQKSMERYIYLLDKTFSLNVHRGFRNSILLARYLGVDESEIISSDDKGKMMFSPCS